MHSGYCDIFLTFVDILLRLSDEGRKSLTMKHCWFITIYNDDAPIIIMGVMDRSRILKRLKKHSLRVKSSGYGRPTVKNMMMMMGEHLTPAPTSMAEDTTSTAIPPTTTMQLPPPPPPPPPSPPPPSESPKTAPTARTATETQTKTTRRPGRPATYVFDKPDSQLSENELRLKKSIVKRRLRQNRSYHRRKERERLRKEQEKLAKQHLDGNEVRQQQQQQITINAPGAGKTEVKTNSSGVGGTVFGFHSQLLNLDEQRNQTNNVQLSPSTRVPVSPPPLAIPPSQSPQQFVAANDAEQLTLPVSAPPVLTSTVTTESSSTGCLTLNNAIAPTTVSPLSMVPSTVPPSLPPASSGMGNIDVEAGDSTLTIPTLTITGFDPSAGLVEDDEEEEDRVISSSLSMTDTLDHVTSLTKNVTDQTELVRMTGLKKIVFNNLRDKYEVLPLTVRRILRHLAVFPRTFDLKAATAVAGLGEGPVMVQIAKSALDKLTEGNFVVAIGERWELNEVAKLFLSEDTRVVDNEDSQSIAANSTDRYVKFYMNTIKRVSEDNIHKIGWARERAMALYDVERDNMEYSQFLSACKSDDHLKKFLTAGISVMRYCVTPQSRIQVIRDALTKNNINIAASKSTGEVSTCSSSLGTPSGSMDVFETAPETPTEHVKNKARLELALGEAYCDTLNMEEAEEPLVRAMTMLWDHERINNDGGMSVDAVLATLLLANLRMRVHKWQEARSLLIRALKILQHRGLGKTTFAINAMSNLVGVYIARQELSKAKILATQLLECLTGMGYENLPIMADARGQTGLVCMSLGEYKEAEQQFAAALEIIAAWSSKKWFDVPIQHCRELDLWLMEGWARAIYMQGRKPEAEDMMQKADQDRLARGLQGEKVFFGAPSSTLESPNRWSMTEKTHTRHVY